MRDLWKAFLKIVRYAEWGFIISGSYIAIAFALAPVLPDVEWHMLGVYHFAYSIAFSQDPIAEAIGSCPTETCTITGNGGGDAGVFAAAEFAMFLRGKQLIIDGPCFSACSILADKLRPNVCVTKRAIFGLHKGAIVLPLPFAKFAKGETSIGLALGLQKKVVLRFDPSGSQDIRDWVASHGGYPGTPGDDPASENVLFMKYPDTARFWPECLPDASS